MCVQRSLLYLSVFSLAMEAGMSLNITVSNNIGHVPPAVQAPLYVPIWLPEAIFDDGI